MPGWGEVLREIQEEQLRINKAAAANPNAPPASVGAPDLVRKKYLAAVAQKTGRNLIVYASAWLQKSQLPGEMLMVHPSDVDGFMEVVRASDPSKGLDLMLHSPGGMPEAAEQIVNYLRQKFSDITVVVPHMAMSAATMMACAGDRVAMGRHSTLGPTDPQIALRTNTGEIRLVSAHSLKNDFDAAKSADPTGYRAWAPLLGQYPPGIIAECDRSLRLTNELVTTWLAQYMFRGARGAKKKAARVAKFFAQPDHHTHSRPLMRDQLKKAGMEISDLEDDNELQDLIMSAYHAVTHTLGGTGATKLIENHTGNAYIKSHVQIPTPQPPQR